MEHRKHHRLSLCLVLLLAMAHFAGNARWLKKDLRPPLGMDERKHLWLCYHIEQLSPVGQLGVLIGSDSVTSKYPPLFHLLSIPMLRLLGRNADAGELYAAIYFSLTIILLYTALRYIVSAPAALLGSFLFSTFPYPLHSSRFCNLDGATTMFVTLILLLLLQDRSRHRRCSSLILGAALGLGLLVKIELILYVLPLLLLSLLFPRSEIPVMRRLLRLGTAIGVAAIVSAPWYLPNLRWTVFEFMLGHSHQYSIGRTYDLPLQRFLFYFYGLPKNLGWLYLSLLVTAIVLLTRHRRCIDCSIIVAWSAAVLLLLSFLSLQWDRLLLPLYPAFAAIIVCWFENIRPHLRKSHRLIALALLLLHGCLLWGAVQWYFPGSSSVRRMLHTQPGEFTVFGYHYHPVEKPWAYQQMLEKVLEDTRPGIVLAIIPEIPDLTLNHLLYTFSELDRGMPAMVEVVDQRSLALLPECDYILVMEGKTVKLPAWISSSPWVRDRIRDAPIPAASRLQMHQPWFHQRFTPHRSLPHRNDQWLVLWQRTGEETNAELEPETIPDCPSPP